MNVSLDSELNPCGRTEGPTTVTITIPRHIVPSIIVDAREPPGLIPDCPSNPQAIFRL